MEQRTEEWFAARLGKVTGSNVKHIRAKTKTGEAAGRRNYRLRLVMERLTAQPISEGYVNADMQRGIDLEEIARARYEAETGNMVDQVAFIDHPKIEGFGISPDGLIGEDGLVEIKCPSMATHIGYWLDGVVPAEYKDQMMAQIACTGRKWCDFVSFDDRVAEDMQLFIIRFQPEESEVKKLENEVIQFLVEVEKDLQKINAKRNKK